MVRTLPMDCPPNFCCPVKKQEESNDDEDRNQRKLVCSIEWYLQTSVPSTYLPDNRRPFSVPFQFMPKLLNEKHVTDGTK